MEKRRKLLFAPWSCKNKKYYAYQTWDSPIRKIFDEGITFDPQEYLYQHGKEKMNKKFLEIVKREKPDYIFLWLIYDEFYLDTLFKIKDISPNTKIINYCGDDDSLFDSYTKYFGKFIDYFFVTHPEFISKHGNKAFLSQATNTDVFRPLDIEKKYDVTFIGTPKTNRIKFMKYLKDNDINIKVFGAGWDKISEFKEVYGGYLDSEDFTKVINQTKVNICFTKNYDGSSHVNQHPFEVAACKVISLVEESPGFLKLYKKGKEIITFSDEKDLLEKVKQFLEKPEDGERIAEAAYKKTLKDLSKDKEFKDIFGQIFKEEGKKPNRFPKLDEKDKVICLTRENLNLSDEELRKKVKNFKFIYFNDDFGENLKYRELFQIASLKKSGKEISCCDYYLNNDKLGDYLSFTPVSCLNVIPKEEFNALLDINQIMITKEYFFSNINKLRKVFSGRKKIDFIDLKNTEFLTFPLVRIQKVKKISFDGMSKAFLPQFASEIRVLKNRKKMLFNKYPYHLLLAGLFRDRYILKYFKAKIKDSLN